MQHKHILYAALLYSGSFYAAAQDHSLQYTHEAFLDRIGLNAQNIAMHEWHARSTDFRDTFLISFANTMRVLTQDESISAQADFYTFMLSRELNQQIFQHREQCGVVHFPYSWLQRERSNSFNINLTVYQQDQELLGKAHREMQKHSDLYDWLVEFRNAQRKEPKLCEPSHLYATARQLFISSDESIRAKKLQAITNNPTASITASIINSTDPFEYKMAMSALRDSKTTFKTYITVLEQAVQENARKQSELQDIAAAFKALTDTK